MSSGPALPTRWFIPNSHRALDGKKLEGSQFGQKLRTQPHCIPPPRGEYYVNPNPCILVNTVLQKIPVFLAAAGACEPARLGPESLTGRGAAFSVNRRRW